MENKKDTDTLSKAAGECMVLLKNSGDFPLNGTTEIALYGGGARRTLKGGTGSGDVDVKEFLSVEKAFAEAGFEITTTNWLDSFDRILDKAHQDFVSAIKEKAKERGVPAFIIGMGAVMPQPEYNLPLDGKGDTAIYILSRNSGEGSDRKFMEGDMKLTKSEIRDILALSKKHKKFMLVLNVCGVVDLEPVMEVDDILVMSMLGSVSGYSLVDVILGKCYPSGKLSSTWTKSNDYSQIGDFGNQDDTRYREGIYVGYRYFDSIGKKPLFPFGYGLSYTNFSFEITGISNFGGEITISAIVRNIGKRAGKEVLQLYVSSPEGKMEKPYQELAAFCKTGEIPVNGHENVDLIFDLSEVSSYDEERASFILEPGDYILRIGTDSQETKVCTIARLDEEAITCKTAEIGGTPDFKDWKPSSPAYSGHGEGNRIGDVPILNIDAESLQTSNNVANDSIIETKSHNESDIDDEDLVYLCVGNYSDTQGGTGILGSASTSVAGAAGQTSSKYEKYGITPLIMADGPAGLRLSPKYRKEGDKVRPAGEIIPAAFRDFIDDKTLELLGIKRDDEQEETGPVFEQNCTAIPTGTALAQSWNPEICSFFGDLVGTEMEKYKVHLWLAPAMNIHRSPLCGRNFEYYSEDPLLSGIAASAVIEGVQKHPGCKTVIKHFACNNQETNRFHSNSIVSQRALREIYLRPFEICIKRASPGAVMTSYNLLNGIHTCNRKDLLTDLLRKEWGFDGIVITDWMVTGTGMPGNHKYPYASAAGCIMAGNDLIMPGSRADCESIKKALEGKDPEYKLTKSELKTCVNRIVSLAANISESFNRR